MELETEAAVNIVSATSWSENLHSPKLESSSLQLQSYPDRKLKVLGCWLVYTKIQNAEIIQLPLTVVEGQRLSLCSAETGWKGRVRLDRNSKSQLSDLSYPARQAFGAVQRCCKGSIGALQRCKSQNQMQLQNSTNLDHLPLP